MRTGLGKGLEALLGDISMPDIDEKTKAVGEGKRETDVQELPINSIDPNRDQPRKQFDEDRLHELAESIKASGVIQPLIVRKNGDRYTIVAGERRWRAARMAGLNSVPVLARDYDDKTLMEVSLIENLQRADLNPIEEAAGIKLLMQQHDLTQEEVAQRLGKSRPAIANAVRLLTLPEDVLAFLRAGELSAGHARCLVALDNRTLQASIAKEIVQKGLSVRATEALCKQRTAAPQQKVKKPMPAELFDVQNQLQTTLLTKVKITGSEKRGKIVIEYFSRDELERLYDILRAQE